MYDVLTRSEFERLWKSFLKQAAGEFLTRGESEAFHKVMLSQTDALQSMIGAVEYMKGQIEALHQTQVAQRAQVVALSAVCGSLANGLIATGVPPEEVRRAIDGARAVLPDDMRAAGEPAIDAVLSIFPEE